MKHGLYHLCFLRPELSPTQGRYHASVVPMSIPRWKSSDVQAETSDNENETISVSDLLFEKFGPRVTVVNPWSQDQSNQDEENGREHFGNLEFFKPLDYKTRYLIQLLQELNWNGFHQNADRVTLTRCRTVLQALLYHHRNKPTAVDGQPVKRDSVEQCAYRAHIILQNMEVFRRKTFKRPLSRQLYGHHDLGPTEWPIPDRHIYDLVLGLFRETRFSLSMEFPRTAHSIVQEMEHIHCQTGDWNSQTTSDHWRAVLVAWGRCQDPQRVVYAGTETFQNIPKRVLESRGGRGYADVFLGMLWICTDEGIVVSSDRNSETHRQVRKLGANVAARIWHKHIRGTTRTTPSREVDQEITIASMEEEDVGSGDARQSPTQQQQQHLDDDRLRQNLIVHLSSFAYSTFFRAIRDLPLEKLREDLFDDCFTLACQQGKVSEPVLREFLINCQSQRLTKNHLGSYLAEVNNIPPQDAVSKLMALLPHTWTQRSDRPNKETKTRTPKPKQTRSEKEPS